MNKSNLIKIIKQMVQVLSISIVLFMLLYYIIPRIIAERPVIDRIEPSIVLEKVMFNDTGEITVYGNGFKDIIGIYVNGKYEPGCQYTVISEEEMKVSVPIDLYNEPGEFNVAVEKRNNSDITSISNKKEIVVAPLDSKKIPVIKSVSPNQLKVDDLSFMWFTVECEEVDEEASVLVDDEEVYAIYDSGNNTFAFKLEYSSWANKDCLYVKVRKNHNGYATPVVSKPYIVNIEKHNWNDYNLEYTWLDNRFISCGLGKLNENDLLVTNSNEDFLYYFGKGQRVFEVDFQFTSDGVLVGKNNFDKEIPVSYEVLQNNTMDFTIVSFEEICQLLLNYKDMYIVTNIKDTNSIAVDRIFQYMVSCAKKYDESILDRIIIQVYNEEMYSQIMEIYPFKSVIYNLSQKTIDDKKVLQFIKSTGIKVVTINENQISDGLIKKLYDLDCYVYVDSVDEIDLVKKYLSKGVYGYYTNSLCEVDSREYLYDIIWDEMDNQSITYNREQFISYLNSLNSERYIVCFAVVDDASMMMTDELHTIFDKWGFSSNILSDFRYSFIGISNNGKAIVEKYDNEALSYSGKIDEIYVEMQSAGFAFGNYSSICIDGTEYSTNVSGLNIVVYDKYLGKVISKVGFNLFSDYTRTDG